MADYTISLKYTREVTSEDNGNFEVLKEYKVTNNVAPRTTYKRSSSTMCEKNSYVTDSTGIEHDTTEAIQKNIEKVGIKKNSQIKQQLKKITIHYIHNI